MRKSGVDALIVTPSADLRYLTGYDAPPLERLTALILPVDSDPVLLVPELEAPEAQRSPAALAGMEIRSWQETDDPHAAALEAAGPVRAVAFDDHMWAAHVEAFTSRASARWRTAGALLSSLRARKSTDEVNSLRQAANAIDRVHARMGSGFASAAPSGTSRATSPMRSSRRATRPPTSRSSRAGATPPLRITACPMRRYPPVTRWSSTSAAGPGTATAPTPPEHTSSTDPRRTASSSRMPCCSRHSVPSASTYGRA